MLYTFTPKSQAIACIGFEVCDDAELGSLYVEYTSGTHVYRYDRTSRREFQVLVEAESVGRAVNEHRQGRLKDGRSWAIAGDGMPEGGQDVRACPAALLKATSSRFGMYA